MVKKIIYDSYINGEDIMKDKDGFFVERYHWKHKKEYKLYLKNYKPPPKEHWLCVDTETGKTKHCISKRASKKSSKKCSKRGSRKCSKRQSRHK